MKRFHVHVSVDDLGKSIEFYSGLFGMPPAVEKVDYAKWMLDDPRVMLSDVGRTGSLRATPTYRAWSSGAAPISESA